MTATHLHLVRVTLEAVSPLSLGSGDEVEHTRTSRDTPPKTVTIHAAALMRDANGLPTVPGASLQGVLAHLYQRVHRHDAHEKMFGYARGDTGKPGRLSVGFGCVHDKTDVAVTGLKLELNLNETNDDVLGLLGNPKALWRDHAALGPRHVVAERQKFARTAAPVGTRFSFELSLTGNKDEEALLQVLALFTHSDFRLGGGSARGYGRVRVVRITRDVCDLADPLRIRKLREQPPSKPLAEVLHDCGARPPVTIRATTADTVTALVTLTPSQPWRIGGFSDPITLGTRGIRGADGAEPAATAGQDWNVRGVDTEQTRDNTLTIAREPRLRWDGATATIEGANANSPFSRPGAFPLPGSALRGPLVHRALFHFNRHRPDGAGMIDADEWLELSEQERDKRLTELAGHPAAFAPLFGAAKGTDTKGEAARLRVNDGEIGGVTHVMAIDHNKIDRFTGGVIKGALYAEEVLVSGTITFEIQIRPPGEDTADGIGGWPQDVALAFLRALADLCAGRLAIGAKSLGLCTGTVAWSDGNSRAAAWKTAWELAWKEAAP